MYSLMILRLESGVVAAVTEVVGLFNIKSSMTGTFTTPLNIALDYNVAMNVDIIGVRDCRFYFTGNQITYNI